MQKVLWKISLIVLILLVCSRLLYTQESTLSYPPDSLEKNIIEYYDANNTDVLQEDLYQRLKKRITNHAVEEDHPPKTKFQFFQNSLKYYPQAILNGDEIVIPYPLGKFKKLTGIRYYIPSGFFENPGTDTTLQPEIILDQDSDRSTLIFNKAYSLVYYRSPGIADDDLFRSIRAIQKTYNLLLPGARMPDYNSILIKGNINYKGYQPHSIQINSLSQIMVFLDELAVEGSLYFYPSRIEIQEDRILIIGLLYVIKDDILNIYHFADTSIIFTNTITPEYSEFKIKFYPYIKNLHVTNE